MRISVAYLLLTVASLIVINPTAALAVDYYVDVNTGSDANSGLSPGDAWKTITRALPLAAGTEEDPARINVASGTYSPETGEIFPLLGYSYQQLVGAGADMTIVDAAGTGPCLFFCREDVVDRFNHVLIEGFSFTGGALPQSPHRSLHDQGGGISVLGHDIVIRNNKVNGNTNSSMNGWGGGIMCAGGNILIENNEVFDNYDNPYDLNGGDDRDGAIYVEAWVGASSVWRVLIKDNYVHDNNCTAINLALSQRPIGDRLILEGNVLENNFVTIGPYDNEDRSIIGFVGTVKDCVITGRCHPYGAGQFHNCLFTGQGHIVARWGDACLFNQVTFAGAADSHAIIYERGECHFFNCIFKGATQGLLQHPRGEAYLENCCIESGWDGAGQDNFAADPLFVSGPLWDYCLSSVEAGQEADSPCVDAGSTSATLAGMSWRTTRTDGAFDTGVVDIGCHYAATPPTVEASVANLTSPSASPMAHFAGGDGLAAGMRIENRGLPLWVDIYAGFILPDGTIYCVSAGGLTTDFVPWAATALLPTDFGSGDVEVFRVQMPEGLPQGAYTFAAALSLTGNFRPIGDIAFSQFTVESRRSEDERGYLLGIALGHDAEYVCLDLFRGPEIERLAGYFKRLG